MRAKIGTNATVLSRAQGCLLGQTAGDSLGSLVEFQRGVIIRRKFPDGLRELKDGGHWDTLAGQPTDDSELALMLARSLVKESEFDEEAVAASYAYWYASDPFDIGATTARALAPAAGCVAQGHAADAARRRHRHQRRHCRRAAGRGVRH
ncbi:MAG TPA: ADP-ribosylglycohydrolase family protein [Tepidisphaeraceae bacterium]|nr:ADP-ribosylglycohydrolase family protein [Tepidisphaeraceae bacterium]